jgi:hypothetical protein
LALYPAVMYVGLAVLTPIFRVQCVALWLGFDIECPIVGGGGEGRGGGVWEGGSSIQGNLFKIRIEGGGFAGKFTQD